MGGWLERLLIGGSAASVAGKPGGSLNIDNRRWMVTFVTVNADSETLSQERVLGLFMGPQPLAELVERQLNRDLVLVRRRERLGLVEQPADFREQLRMFDFDSLGLSG